MSHGVHTAGRHRMGWAALGGAALVLLFWILYFAGVIDVGQEDPAVRAFESAFPIADAVFCAALIGAGYALLMGTRAGPFLLGVAGSMSVYLGTLDLTFYGARGTYYPLHAEGLFQLSLSLICIGAGALGLGFGWKFWKEQETGSPERARRTNISDRVMLITGSASGIGEATVRRLADEDATLVLADIDEDALERQRAELAARAPGRIVAIQADVSDRDAVDDLVEAALLSFGRLDVLVNCAGVLYPGEVEHLPERALRAQIDTNLLGTIHTTRALLPYFRRQRSGHFVHIASLGGFVPLPGSATYCATKFAVRGFCQALALELRDTPLQVSVIHPDSTDTPQLRAEALHAGSSLSFTSRPLPADVIARAIVKTIQRPRREVCVPQLRGWLVRLAGLAPWLLEMLYPALNHMGTRNREKYAAAARQQAITSIEPQAARS